MRIKRTTSRDCVKNNHHFNTRYWFFLSLECEFPEWGVVCFVSGA